MRKRKRLGLLVIAASVFIGFGTVSQADMIIDDFTPGTGVYSANDTRTGLVDVTGHTATSVDPDPNNLLDGEIFGGSRDLYVLSNTSRSSISLNLDIDGIVFDMQHSTDAPDLIAPDIAHITWDGAYVAGNGGTPDFGIGNFSTLSGTAFQLISNEWDVSRYAAIQVWEAGNTEESHTVQFELLANEDEHNVSFVHFINAGIDFQNIAALRLHFLTDEIEFDLFQTVSNPSNFAPVVPVPAAAGLGFLGMALVAAYRRKQGAKA